MNDREKIIKALRICAVGTNSCEKCPLKDKCHGTSNAAMAAAIEELLKEQEPVEPQKENDGNPGKWANWWYVCGNCGRAIDYRDRFCRYCGKAVKWNAAD